MAHARHISSGITRLFTKPGRTTRARLVGAVLLAFTLRAFIPLGFMPASDGSFSLMICPAGLPATLLQGMGDGMSMPGGMEMPQHQYPGHGLGDGGYCAFTTGCSSAPPTPLPLAALLLLLSCLAVITVTVPAPVGIRLVYIPQARAPPALI
ncbi:MAG: hypothetical protein WAU49_19695 [Steroidobacteraceae bacterium]